VLEFQDHIQPEKTLTHRIATVEEKVYWLYFRFFSFLYIPGVPEKYSLNCRSRTFLQIIFGLVEESTLVLSCFDFQFHSNFEIPKTFPFSRLKLAKKKNF